MLPTVSYMRALVCLLFFLNVAAAAVPSPVRRRGGNTTPASTLSPSSSDTHASATASASDKSTITNSPSSLANITSSSSTSIIVTTTAPALLGEPDGSSSSASNTTTANGGLPIEPQVTPGFGVAGTLLLITGAVYALIGIKNQWVHAFLSTAYLGALGTTILIIYLMTPPVSNGVQGAFVVAAVFTGLLLGAGACVFKEITEALGCLLGGFCLSMWLMTLTDGGLVQQSGSKVIFIAAFTLASFASYFSQYTRIYGLIASISFAGATAIMLGLDCFSRAGLKEFWVYIWNLNNDLFPLGTDTYPVTKGIRAETAIIVIIFIIGIISQMKLWRIVKERRDKRAAERAEGERSLREEEEAAGRRIEAQNAREREEWEATYGGGPPVRPSGDSGVGEMENEKPENKQPTMRNSQSISKDSSAGDAIEMAELPATPEQEQNEAPEPPPKKSAAEIMITKVGHDGMVTVRVAADDVPVGSPSEEQEKLWVVGPDGNARPASKVSKTDAADVAPAPKVVPLPFRVPAGAEDEVRSIAARSSVATFADEEGGDKAVMPRSKRGSLAKRLSRSSVELLRRLSQRTGAGDLNIPRSPTNAQSESTEELVIPIRDPGEDDRRSSLAVTIDGLSSDGDNNSIRDGRPVSIEINAALAESSNQGKTTETPTSPTSPLPSKPADKTEDAGVASGKETKIDSDDVPKEAKSVASVASTPVTLTKERLPRALSRIALSYRTNEWAKHLSLAETPEPDGLQLNEYHEVETKEKAEEAPAPVDVQDLKLTAENGTLPPASRSVSATSNSAVTNPALARDNSKASTYRRSLDAPGAPALESSTSLNSPYQATQRNVSGNRRISTDILARPIAEEGADVQNTPLAAAGESPETTPGLSNANSVSTSSIPAPIPPESLLFRSPVPGVVSYSSPQTLIGKREMLLRNKSSPSLAANPSYANPMPEPIPGVNNRAPSEAGSLYNYPAYASLVNGDADDIPLSQRRELMARQSSLQALGGRPPSSVAGGSVYTLPVTGSSPAPTADSIPFNSHQPQRTSGLPTPEAREIQLANFRQSVAAELRNGAPLNPVTNTSNPYTNGSLLSGGVNSTLLGIREGEGTVRYSIDAQRNFLMSQKGAEAAKREMERVSKERVDRAFEERMRTGELLAVHREAMRRMQNQSRAE